VMHTFIPHYAAHMKLFENMLEVHAQVERVLVGLSPDEVQQYRDIFTSARFPWRETETLTKHGGERPSSLISFVFPPITSTIQDHLQFLADCGVEIDISRVADLKRSLRLDNDTDISEVKPPAPRVIALPTNIHTTGNLSSGGISFANAEKEVAADGGLTFASVQEVIRYLLVDFLYSYSYMGQAVPYFAQQSRSDIISEISKKFQRNKREGYSGYPDTRRTQFPQHRLRRPGDPIDGSTLVLESPRGDSNYRMGDVLSFSLMSADAAQPGYSHAVKVLAKGRLETPQK